MPGLKQVAEKAVPASLARTYVEIRDSLRGGYVPLPMRALAAMPGVLKPLWGAIGPNVMTRAFEQGSDELRARLAQAAVSLGTPLIETVLAANGCDVDELDALRANVHRFQYVDPKVMIALEAMDALLSGEQLSGSPAAAPMLAHVPPPDALGSIEMVSEAPGGVVGEVLASIQRELHLPSATNDLRALGSTPVFLEVAWDEIGPMFAHARPEPFLVGPRARARRIARSLPYPMQLAPGAIADAHAHAEARRLVEHFVDAWPRLTLFVAALRVALDGPEDALLSPMEVEWPEEGAPVESPPP